MKPWTSGFCGSGNHPRCSGGNSATPAGEWVECSCECHATPSAAESAGRFADALRDVLGRGPGVYDDLPNADYHAETDWLSASQLKGHLPEFYSPPTGRDALDFGAAFHAKVLGNGDPVRVVDLASWRSKAAERARAEADAVGETPILAADAERIEAMAAAVKAHPVAARWLHQLPGRSEVSVFAEEDGLRVKCRPDRLLDCGVVVDLKSTSSKPGHQWITRSVMDFGYDLQAEHYLATCAAADLAVSTFVFVFVTKTEPYRVTVAELDDTLLADGARLRSLAIARHRGERPAYDGAAEHLTLTQPFRRDIPA